MKPFILASLVALAFTGCTDDAQPTAGARLHAHITSTQPFDTVAWTSSGITQPQMILMTGKVTSYTFDTEVEYDAAPFYDYTFTAKLAGADVATASITNIDYEPSGDGWDTADVEVTLEPILTLDHVPVAETNIPLAPARCGSQRCPVVLSSPVIANPRSR